MKTMSQAGPECSVGRQAAERHLRASSRLLALPQGAVPLLWLGKYTGSVSMRSSRVQPAVQALQNLCSSDDCFHSSTSSRCLAQGSMMWATESIRRQKKCAREEGHLGLPAPPLWPVPASETINSADATVRVCLYLSLDVHSWISRLKLN